MREEMKRSLVLLIATLIVLATLASACSLKKAPAPTSQPSPGARQNETAVPSLPAKTAIVIWHGWQGEYLAAIQTIVNEYMAAHKDVSIELKAVSDMNSKVMSGDPNGETADILAFTNDWIGQLADAGKIVALNSNGVSDSFLNDTYIGTAASAMKYKGKIWALPEAVECVSWIYNKSLVKPEDLPANTDDLIAKARAFNASNLGKYYFVYPARNDVFFSSPWWYGTGGFLVKEDGSVGLNTAEGIAAARLISQLDPLMPKDVDYAVATSLFKEGKAAIIQDGPWLVADAASAKIDFGLALIPKVGAAGKPGAPFVWTKALMVTATCKNPKVAADILKTLTSKQSQITLAKAFGTVPTNKAALDDAAVKALATVSHYGRQATAGTAMPSTPYMSAIWQSVPPLLESLWNGSAQPEAAVKAAQDKALEIIAGMK
jgi:maltose-binding protein MalE